MGSLFSSWSSPSDSEIGESEFIREYGTRNENGEIKNWQITVQQLSEETGFTEAQVVVHT